LYLSAGPKIHKKAQAVLRSLGQALVDCKWTKPDASMAQGHLSLCIYAAENDKANLRILFPFVGLHFSKKI
jgi:hypothetical protein